MKWIILIMMISTCLVSQEIKETMPQNLIDELSKGIAKHGGNKLRNEGSMRSVQSLSLQSLKAGDSNQRNKTAMPMMSNKQGFPYLIKPAYDNYCTAKCAVCQYWWNPWSIWRGFWCLVRKMYGIFKCFAPLPCAQKKTMIRYIFSNFLNGCHSWLKNILKNWFNFVIQHWCW